MLFISPEYVVYLYQVNRLKDTVTDKIVERDYLIHYLCKDLKTDYMLKIGSLEYKKILLQNKIKRIKRKIELIKELEVFNEDEIEEMIKNEFKESTDVEKDIFSEINTAIDYSLQEVPTKEELEILNSNYAVIVRTWNPSINLKLSEERQKLYKEAEKAYETGNNALLENYTKLIKDDEIIEQGEIEELKIAKERYMSILQENEAIIRMIKNSFPFNEKKELEDEILFRRKKEKINEETEQARQELEKTEKELEKILKNRSDRK